MELTHLIELLQKQIGSDINLEVAENSYPEALMVPAEYIKAICQLLHKNEQCYYDMLSCLTGLDNGLEANTLEVVYNLYSIPYDRSLMLKVVLDRENPEIDSVVDIWRTAEWHEREAFDLIGVKFLGHPDLRRILLPADWEGHPLRKDYQHQEYYRGIKVEY